MIGLKIGGIIVAAFIAGAFVASPELRAYAANTVYSTDIVDGEVKNPDIAAGAVTNSKIAGNSISNTKIQNNAITLPKIAANSVDGSKILDNSITAADIGPDAVRASELAGVSRLIFGAPCTITFLANSGGIGPFDCPAPGAKIGDHVVATLQSDWVCGDTPLLHSARVVNNDKATLAIVWNTSCGPDTVEASVIVYQN